MFHATQTTSSRGYRGSPTADLGTSMWIESLAGLIAMAVAACGDLSPEGDEENPDESTVSSASHVGSGPVFASGQESDTIYFRCAQLPVCRTARVDLHG